MESNKKALTLLLILVFTSLALFCLEKKFLVAQKRGTGLNSYAKIPWLDKILLLVDDFEGMSADTSLLQEKFFEYGSARIGLDTSRIDTHPLALGAALKVTWNGEAEYGGWGKGVGENIDLDVNSDHLTFRIYVPKTNPDDELIKIILEEDDNDDGKLQKDKDDTWFCLASVEPRDEWQLLSIPLKDFKDENDGGDHVFNVNRKGGLHTIIFSMMRTDKYTPASAWYFDFIFFSAEKIVDTGHDTSLN